MSIYHKARAGARGGKDQFNWDTVKSDKDRECYLGHSLMAPTGRWQEGKDLTWYAKDRENEQQMKSAEFRAAKKVEEEALMAALGMRVMPPPAAPTPSIQHKPVIKREPQSTRIKNEPMTPAIHNDPRNAKQHHHSKKNDNQRKEDRRRRRQLKATASDEEKNDWSEDDEDDLIDQSDDDDEDDKPKQSMQQDMMTEKDLDEFLIDLVKKHGLKAIQRTLKLKKDKKERKRKHSPASSPAASESEEEKQETKHKHKKKHSHKEEPSSTKRHRTRSSSPSSSSRKDRPKHHRNR